MCPYCRCSSSSLDLGLGELRLERLQPRGFPPVVDRGTLMMIQRGRRLPGPPMQDERGPAQEESWNGRAQRRGR
jgi:hypothetical protein